MAAMSTYEEQVLNALFEEQTGEPPIDPNLTAVAVPTAPTSASASTTSGTTSAAAAPSSPPPTTTNPSTDAAGATVSTPSPLATFELAPPLRKFDSYAAAIAWGHEWSQQTGVELVRMDKGRHFKNRNNVKYKYIWRCKRAGKLDNKRKLTDETRKRRTVSSLRTDCPMKVILVACDPEHPDGTWEVRDCSVPCRTHNHPQDTPEALPGVRKRTFTPDVMEIIRTHHRLGIPRAETLAMIKRFRTGFLGTSRDLANITKNLKVGQLQVHEP